MRKRILLAGLLELSGCAPYAETFECEVGPGVGCKSLTFVNQLVERGDLPYEEENLDTFEELRPYRKKPPAGKRVWIAGYRDEEGHYHEPAYLWLGEDE